MAISMGGLLVRGTSGHLMRDVTTGHLLRRDTLAVSLPIAVQNGDVSLTLPGRLNTPYVRSDFYPDLYDNRSGVTWANGSLEIYSYYYNQSRLVAFPSIYSYTGYSGSRIAYALYDTSAANGMTFNFVKTTVSTFAQAAGGGTFGVGFYAQPTATIANSYDWVAGGTSFIFSDSGTNNIVKKSFTSDFTFDDYLIITAWVTELEVPTSPSSVYAHRMIIDTSRVEFGNE